MTEVKPEPTRYSVHLNVPENVARPLDLWAENAEGASLPATGWHITLLPPFVSKADEQRLVALVNEVAARHSPFAIELDTVEQAPDRTRQGFAAVFLSTTREQERTGPLFDLQTDLAQTLATLRMGILPGLEETNFWPHVTLALAVSEKEAERLARSARRATLALSFRVNAFWLTRVEPMTTGEVNAWRRRFALANGNPISTSVQTS